MSQPRNVIMIVADSLRFDSVYHNGQRSLTPYLQENAIQFTQARSGGCWTLPATASLFSGLMPHEHGATSQTRAINKEVPTLAERMKAAGYETYQITANVATTHIFGLDRGFDEVIRVWDFVPARFNRLQQFLVLMGKPRLRKILFSKDAVVHRFSEDLRAATSWLQLTYQDIFDKARGIIENHEKQGKKTFLFINLMESHFPYHVAPTFQTTSDNWGGKLAEVKSLFHLVNQTFLTKEKAPVNPAVLNQLRERQRKSWKIIGPGIDQFARELHEGQDNMVLFCADHGDNFGDQGWQYHFSNVTDGGNKVPIFLLKHGQKTAKTVDQYVNSKDLYHTILKESGVDDNSFSLADDPDRSISVMQSFWYNNKGQTLSKFKFNQFCFVENGERYLLRDDRWFHAPVGINSSEPLFKTMSAQTNPLEELMEDSERKKQLQEAVQAFQQFSAKVGNGKS